MPVEYWSAAKLHGHREFHRQTAPIRVFRRDLRQVEHPRNTLS